MSHEHDGSRRQALKSVAAIGVAVTLPAGVLAPCQAQAAGIAAPALSAPSLSVAERGILEAVVARLIPSDAQSPGAKEARAADYIDRALGDALAGARKAYTAGLAALDAYALASKGVAFVALSADDQDALLSALEKNTATGFTPNAATFFNLLLGHTLQGTFCDPAYGGNAGFVGWDLIGYPGLRMAVAPEEQRMGVKVKPYRQSAYADSNLPKGGGHGH